MRWLVRQVADSLTRDGLYATLSKARRVLLRKVKTRYSADARKERREAAAFDRRFGLDTKGDYSSAELSAGQGNTGYQGISIGEFRDLMRHWRREASEADTTKLAFVDVGCGKGRAVLLAAETPFRSVLGVEVVPTLAAIAESNVVKARESFACRDVRIICEDALKFDLPEGDLLVFLYNPFTSEVLQGVLKRLAERRKSEGRRSWIVATFDPKESAPFEKYSRARYVFGWHRIAEVIEV